MVVKKVNKHVASELIIQARHYIQLLRKELEWTNEPERVQRYIDAQREDIKALKKGFMIWSRK